MKARPLWPFPGGLQLPAHKDESAQTPIVPAALPGYLLLPLQQHRGEAAKPVVKAGDHVLKGQLIATAQGNAGAPIHASSSGTITAIENVPIPHPAGLNTPGMVLETDGEDRWIQCQPVQDDLKRPPGQLRRLIRQAGIAGLGGADLPPSAEPRIETLILNGAECEPYITCDDRLMRESAGKIVQGARIMRQALQARHCLIGLEDNKPAAYTALVAAAAETEDIEIIPIPTRYPSGGEKQLIKTLTGKEVPSGSLPPDMGIACHNVATAAAVHQAIRFGIPLISRIVTVTGSAVGKPRNLEVLLGTPIHHVLAQCNTAIEAMDRLIIGGPMRGFALRDDAAPVTPTTHCLLTNLQEEVQLSPVMPCIQCGACVEVCPARLQPQQLYRYAKAKDFAQVRKYHLFDCIECGCCDYVCPSHIPLVHYFRYAKDEIRAQEQERKKANLARRRYEFRQQRLAQAQQERAARQQAKKAAVAPSATEEEKRAVIRAAVERVRAKRAAQAKSTDHETTPPSSE